MRFKNLLFLGMLSILVLTARANLAVADSSGTVYWSAPVSACTPGTNALDAASYLYWLNYVSHRGTNTDNVAFYCAVQPNTGASAPNRLVLTYLDSTGTSSSAFVKAEFYRIDVSTGGYNLLATASSDSSVATGVNQVFATVSSMDFSSYYYYVRVIFDRTTSSETTRAFGVRLENAP